MKLHPSFQGLKWYCPINWFAALIEFLLWKLMWWGMAWNPDMKEKEDYPL